METWHLIFLLGLLFSSVIYFLFVPSKKKCLPPGPPAFPFVGNLHWLRLTPSIPNIETLLRDLAQRLGPVVTLHFGPVPAIFIADRVLAHKALVELGAAFANRPPPVPVNRLLNARVLNIISSQYGSVWRHLRRNLTSEILHPAKIRLFSDGRRWVLDLLVRNLKSKSDEFSDGIVDPKENFQFAMFCLLALMCFGERLDERIIREIEAVQSDLIVYSAKYLRVFALVPKFLSKLLFKKRLITLLKMRQRRADLFLPLIRARRTRRELGNNVGEEESFVYSYVDSLLEIKLEEEGGRQLCDEEIVTLCSEFLTAGTSTTAASLQWTMAEIVDRRAVQEKLVEEIKNVVGRISDEIKEDDLQKMPYLKAVVMEGLRRHPPAHFVLPHSVTKDMEFEGWLIPKNSSINFTVANFGWDEKVWKEPMEFKPERFLKGGDGEGVDITGSREIKMMPFGIGRRICPGIGLAMLHIEYFVANLVKEFEWGTVDGEKIDLSEKSEFITVMKEPLRVRITPRRNASTV